MGFARRLRPGLKGLAYLVVALAVLAAGLIGFVRTPAGQDELRALIVSQAGRVLDGTLEIGRFSGSMFGGVVLDQVRLVREGVPVIEIERVTVDYRLAELTGGGATRIRRLELTRPRVRAARMADGRWNLGALIRRNPNRPRGSGGRPVTIDAVSVADGDVTFADPLVLGSAHVPTSITGLQSTLALSYARSTWTFQFGPTRFVGRAPDLQMRQLAGTLAVGDGGWRFDALQVAAGDSDFTLGGRVDQSVRPSVLDLAVDARRLHFQEWSGVLQGLSNIAVTAAFDARLVGPPSAMQTDIRLRSDGGDVTASVVLDSSVPGWHARGTATLGRLDLAHWLNRPERASDISGDARIDVDLQLGGHFPVGRFTFSGPHVRYLEYVADDVQAEGRLSATDVLLDRVTATVYGANVRLSSGTLGIDAPNSYHVAGVANGLDLRRVPASVPVPRVESSLVLDFDVTGRFVDPVLRGQATFGDSTFLGATVRAGTTGSIDTQVVPFHYAGEGSLEQVDLNHFGQQLQIDWLTQPKYAGTVRGHFAVEGTGSELATMTLSGGGHLDEARLFRGRLSDADVHVDIARGSLDGTFDGFLDQVDPAVAMADPLYDARLSGRARATFAVRDLMIRAPLLPDYTFGATLDLGTSVVRGINLTRGHTEASLSDSVLTVTALTATGPAIDVDAHGTLALDDVRESRLEYRVPRADLPGLRTALGLEARGTVNTSGLLSGTVSRPHVTGDGTIAAFAMSSLAARQTRTTYDLRWPTEAPSAFEGHLDATLESAQVGSTALDRLALDASRDTGRLVVRATATLPGGEQITGSGAGQLDLDARSLEVGELTLDARRTTWQLDRATAPRVTWTDTAFSVTPLRLVSPNAPRQQVAVVGTWDTSGAGATSGLQVTLQAVVIDPFTSLAQGVTRYGGTLDADFRLVPAGDRVRAAGTFSVTNGRVRRLAYERFSGRLDYAGDVAQVDMRLDQAPGVWMTASGSVPASVFDRTAAAQPVHLEIKSSPIALGLLEGVSDLVKNVDGRMQLDVTVLGTTQDPHFAGRVDLTDAAFDVVSSGARYRRGRLALALSRDRVTVETLHVEDDAGHPLDVTGSLGTHELRVGDLQVAVNARAFQVLRNEFGRVTVDAKLNLAGEFESPRLSGAITVAGGSTINVDRILDRTLFQPYATQETALPDLDPIVALNPWERLGLDVELHVPGTLRMVGENVQVSPGTPLGLGDISLRAFGDLYLYKDPAQPMYVTGSFDSLTGTYAFQGRRFDLDPISSINFRGDLNPELYVTVDRLISGVDTRVSIVGSLAQPELRLASTPPLDASDILSLIVFNTSTNELSALQQQQLAIRAGTLAAGFIAAPMVSALERTLGIDTLEIEPGADIRGGARVTVGNEIAPGLVARFSRQFGEADYDEATLEYYLSRILRIRATFSDAGTLTARSPFRRVERAGIDLLLFFSF